MSSHDSEVTEPVDRRVRDATLDGTEPLSEAMSETATGLTAGTLDSAYNDAAREATREDRRRVRLKHRRKEALTPEERAIYRYDRVHRKEKLRRLQEQDKFMSYAAQRHGAASDSESDGPRRHTHSKSLLTPKNAMPFFMAQRENAEEKTFRELTEKEQNLAAKINRILDAPFGVSTTTDKDADALSKRAHMGNCRRVCFDCRRRFRLMLKHRRDPIAIWRGAIKKVDGHFGSSIVQYFVMIRWIFMLNLIMTLVWLGFLAVPYMLVFDWSSLLTVGVQGVLGTGLNETFFFYSGYPATVSSGYRIDLAYPLVLVAVFLISIAAVLYSLRSRILRSSSVSIVRRDAKVPFSTAVFNAWDYTLTEKNAARTLQRGLAVAWKELAAGVQLKFQLEKQRRMGRLQCLRVFCGFLTLGLLAAAIVVITYVTLYETEIVAATFSFMTSLIIGVINAGVPFIIKRLSNIEKWQNKKFELYYKLVRIYVIRIVNITYLLVRYYSTSATSSCQEYTVAVQFWRLLVIDFAINTVTSIFGTLLLVRINRCRKLRDPKIEFDLAQRIVDLTYRQALTWIGMIWCPVLTTLSFISFFLTFYVQYGMLMTNCRPPERPWDASRAGVFFYSLVCITLVIAIAPFAFFFARESSSCGPHQAYSSTIIAAFTTFINNSTYVVKVIFSWLFNPVVLVSVIILFCIVIYFLKARMDQFKKRLHDTTEELIYESQHKTRIIRYTKKLVGHARAPKGAPVDLDELVKDSDYHGDDDDRGNKGDGNGGDGNDNGNGNGPPPPLPPPPNVHVSDAAASAGEIVVRVPDDAAAMRRVMFAPGTPHRIDVRPTSTSSSLAPTTSATFDFRRAGSINDDVLSDDSAHSGDEYGASPVVAPARAAPPPPPPPPPLPPKRVVSAAVARVEADDADLESVGSSDRLDDRETPAPRSHPRSAAPPPRSYQPSAARVSRELRDDAFDAAEAQYGRRAEASVPAARGVDMNDGGGDDDGAAMPGRQDELSDFDFADDDATLPPAPPGHFSSPTARAADQRAHAEYDNVFARSASRDVERSSSSSRVVAGSAVAAAAVSSPQRAASYNAQMPDLDIDDLSDGSSDGGDDDGPI